MLPPRSDEGEKGREVKGGYKGIIIMIVILLIIISYGERKWTTRGWKDEESGKQGKLTCSRATSIVDF
jgi:hypothetical protein